MIKNYKIVEVEWFDAQTHSGYAEDIGDLKDWNPVNSFSVGYLLHEDKEKIILGFLVFMDGKEVNAVKHCQMIPKGMIKNVITIKDYND
jgi:hypothetical protein